MPSLDEINAVSKETPVFILHLYDRALLNKAALNAIGYDKNTQEMPGTRIERDKEGNPTGMLIANPNAIILYATLAQGPKLNKKDQINSTLHFMRELNRLGITSVIDAGGGFQNYPKDYQRWTCLKFFNKGQDFLIGKNFWDFLGGTGAYENLINIYEDVGEEIRPILDKKFKDLIKES